MGLRAAIEKARAIWEKERRHPAPVASVYRHLGYSGRTGPSLTALASLKRYGLLADAGPGLVRLSDMAVSIILAPTADHPDRVEAIRKAALLPSVFTNLWAQYGEGGGQLASDDTMKYYLVKDLNFTEEAAVAVIRHFRDTVEFAQLSSVVESEDGESRDELGDPPPPPQTGNLPETHQQGAPGGRKPPGKPEAQSIRFPLSDSVWATLQVPVPMSEHEWDQLISALTVFKPAIVRRARDVADADGDDA
jgi:hypothetical protein